MQPAGQRPGPHAPAAPLLRAQPPAASHDPEGTGGEAVYDAARLQPGEEQRSLLNRGGQAAS